ncbi:MAG TPA: hypothetical protein VGN12_17190 [Pirellulales bacterium]
MHTAIDFLFLRTWWTYATARYPAQAIPYHWFNLFEGTVWLVFAVLVVLRWARYRNGAIELWYALAFAFFGLSDYREAWVLQSWLIWAKIINLVALVWLRATVMRRYYPQSKLY